MDWQPNSLCHYVPGLGIKLQSSITSHRYPQVGGDAKDLLPDILVGLPQFGVKGLAGMLGPQMRVFTSEVFHL